jgi:hypothetical protein
MTSVTLNVPDISCEHCQHAITAALSPVEGIEDEPYGKVASSTGTTANPWRLVTDKPTGPPASDAPLASREADLRT